MLLLLLLLIAVARASPGLDALSAGDAARFAGDRGLAVARYREAVDSGEPAPEAMARLRLLSLTGNWGMAAHGAAIDRALMEAEGPWAALARADFHLMAPAVVGATPARAVDLALEVLVLLPGPAMARLYLATGDPLWLERLAGAQALDGLARGLLDTGGALWEDPGTWFLGLGVSGAPGAGFGGGLVFVHPDLAWRRWALSTQLAGTTRGTVLGGFSLTSPGPRLLRVGGLAARSVVDLHLDEGVEVYVQRALEAELALGLRQGPWTLALGPRARWDDVGAGLLGAVGPSLSLALDGREGQGLTRRGHALALSVDWAAPPLSDYESLRVFADGRLYVGALRGVGALRLTWGAQLMPLEDERALFFALPSAGGAELHRGARAGRYRAPHIATLDLEQRWGLVGPLEGVVFGNLAAVSGSGLHPGAGLGLRLRLPPQAFNVVRLDLAVSDSGWGVYTAFGDTF